MRTWMPQGNISANLLAKDDITMTLAGLIVGFIQGFLFVWIAMAFGELR